MVTKTDVYKPSSEDIRRICHRAYGLVMNRHWYGDTRRRTMVDLMQDLRTENINLLQAAQPLITDPEDLQRSRRSIAHLANQELPKCSR